MSANARIRKIWEETPEIKCFELVAADGSALPEIDPGAHIDVHLGDELNRQYSLWNGPDITDCYRIGVKREPESRGGSVAMHALKEGDTISIDFPRNNFTLKSGSGRTVLLAGGIGITPLLSMAQHLAAERKPATLHLFARDAKHAPFLDELAALPSAPVHLGLIPPTLDAVLKGILGNLEPDAHVFMCGPGPFMDLVDKTAAICGVPTDHLHMEYFSVDPETLDVSGDSFEVVFAKSGKSAVVEDDQTIIEVMEELEIEFLTSCEQGVCGTCMANVIDGTPDHRDHYLNDAEKASGKVMMPCVSRCKGKRIVLDM